MRTFALMLTLIIPFISSKSTSAQTTPDPDSPRLEHIAVYVTNLQESASFYKDVLKLTEIEEPFKDGRHVWFTLGAAGNLHLIQGAQKKIEHDKNDHLCFSVSSVDNFIIRLNQQKIEYSNWPGTEKAPTVRVDGVKQIYFQDPDGHWIEINDAK
ncbi:VOC family protein [Albibacterium sp.]|uniref:VOC family protein n=1 Tax=Albibacterium sp. TaxID=2952885 RepID=UPI002B6EC7C6|nr:VOC family protein [Albibacterium sp.]HUH18297.1 VOC family protein [Albibacterium sp.]